MALDSSRRTMTRISTRHRSRDSCNGSPTVGVLIVLRRNSWRDLQTSIEPAGEDGLTKHSYRTLMQRLQAAGFERSIARAVALPDWWDAECEKDPSLLPEVEMRVARFVGAPLEVVRDPTRALAAPAYPGAQLHRVRSIERDRLSAAIHMGLSVAGAVLRSWAGGLPPLVSLPSDGVAWHEQLRGSDNHVQLRHVISDLWERGIPVIHLEVVPSPSYQGMACVVDGRPAIVIAHDIDEPTKLAFVVSHEAGHIARDDCDAEHPVVDEEDEDVVADDREMEKLASQYATRALAGRHRY